MFTQFTAAAAAAVQKEVEEEEEKQLGLNDSREPAMAS